MWSAHWFVHGISWTNRTRYSSYLKDKTLPPAVNAIGTPMRDLTNPGLTQWPLIGYLSRGKLEGEKKNGTLSKSKNQIQPRVWRINRLTRGGTGRDGRTWCLPRSNYRPHISNPTELKTPDHFGLNASHTSIWSKLRLSPCAFCRCSNTRLNTNTTHL